MALTKATPYIKLILFVFLVANALLFMNYYSALERIEKEDKEDIKQHITKEINRLINQLTK